MSRTSPDGFFFACPRPEALDAAVAIREQGGNAVDAAVAAAATLSVCYPHMTGLGGDLFALVGTPSDGVWVINGSGRAPSHVDRNELYERHGSEMPRQSPATITVPGAVMAWRDLLERFGKSGIAPALSHAIGLATNGIRVSTHLARALQEGADRLIQDPGIRSIFYPTGQVPKAGDLLVLPQLASVLSEIAEQGADSIYRGDIADALVTFLNSQGSAMSKQDLSDHRSSWCRPVSQRYRSYQLCTTPPNSQGSTLLMVMEEIERRDLMPDHLGKDASAIAELFRRAMLDRDASLGDPAVTSRSSSAHPSSASEESTSQSTRPFRPRADTVGVVAVDSDGWWVSLNQSLFDSFGAGIAEPLTGIVFHNRGAGFSLQDGLPGTLRPGIRPPHTLMPTLVLESGSPVVALATMGGSAHPQIQAEVLMALLRNGDANDAVRRPRWLAGGTSGEDYSVCVAEPEIPSSVRDKLAREFREIVEPTTANGVGHAQTVACLPGNSFVSAADFRSEGCSYPTS